MKVAAPIISILAWTLAAPIVLLVCILGALIALPAFALMLLFALVARVDPKSVVLR